MLNIRRKPLVGILPERGVDIFAGFGVVGCRLSVVATDVDEELAVPSSANILDAAGDFFDCDMLLGIDLIEVERMICTVEAVVAIRIAIEDIIAGRGELLI